MSSRTVIHKGAMQTYGLGSRPADVWGTWPPTRNADGLNPSSGAQTQRTVVRAIVVGDQAMARRILRRELRLEPDFEVVGEADTAAAAVALAQDVRPDIVVMDVEMPTTDGVEAARRVHALAPDCVILLLTTLDSVDTHERGRAAGARVVLQKGSPAIFKSTLHDLVQFVKARNMPAWPEGAAVDAQAGDEQVSEQQVQAEPVGEPQIDAELVAE